MPYIGQAPTQAAFVTDTFSGNGSTTAFTMSVAPANTASVLVVVSGVLQDPSTYSVSGLTLTFSGAPPTGTGNISARYLGIPASGVTTTAYRTVTEFTATANQKTFTPPSYTAGFINVYRNGILLGSADYTATNGTTVVLATGATSGDLVTVESFLVSSVLNAIPNTAGAISLSGGVVTGILPYAQLPTGSVLQVVQTITSTATVVSTNTYTAITGLTASITPKSSTSKILINFTTQGVASGGANNGFGAAIYKGGSLLYSPSQTDGTGPYSVYNSSSSAYGSFNFQYLDSPATTSSVTYAIYGRPYNSAVGAVTFNSGNSPAGSSFITLMEIAG
jgi:hypothetical protein